MVEDRAKLASQLVRCHALLWSVDDAAVKTSIRQRIKELEYRIAALDRPGGMPAPASGRPLAGRIAR